MKTAEEWKKHWNETGWRDEGLTDFIRAIQADAAKSTQLDHDLSLKIIEHGAQKELEIKGLKQRIAELEAASAPSVPDGWQLVQIEPTDAMLKAGLNAVAKTRGLTFYHLTVKAGYSAMLDAAPKKEDCDE